MNNISESLLYEELQDTHLWDWHAHGWSAGAFAMFGPDEFSTVMPILLKPAHDGKVHFAGEALSSGYAWIIGAVNSAYRTVLEVLAVEQRNDLTERRVQMWK
jgi:monoamine oxidase